MRRIFALAFCAVLTAGGPGQMRQLQEQHRMFELRAMLDQPGGTPAETPLYRAIAAASFGHELEATGQFRAFLATKPAPELERKARYELSSALTRLGEYGQAASEIAAALRLTPEGESGRADSENVRGMLESLRGVGKPAIEFGPPTPVQARRSELGLWNVPVEVNSQRGEWIFDTGANFSTVSESEARRMGLAVREVHAYARGFTQAKNSTRLAVAGELRFGSARLHNVVFLVLADQALFVAPLKVQIHGILGIPAMRSLGCVDVSPQGVVTLDCGAKPPQVPPNLFFDGLNPIVQVVHSGHNLQMMLDTGTNVTALYPSMRDALAQWERDQLAGTAGAGFAGAGGSEQREADLVPSIQLEVLGRAVYLQRISLLRKAPAGTTGRDGILGLDALAGGFRLDFRAMRFTLK